MNLIVSEDGYAVTGDKPLKHFGYGIASLNQELTDWIILLKSKDSIVNILKNKEITHPRISLFHDRVYVIVEGDVQENFHYIMDIDDYNELISQITREKKISFGLLNQDETGVEDVFLFDIII